MKASIVRIGNSQGIRIPKPIIQQTGIRGDVEISIEGNTIVISKFQKPRSDWSEAFKRMHELGDDTLLDADSAIRSNWDDEEWEWK